MLTSPQTFTRYKVASSIATLFSGSAIAQALTALTLLLTARQLQANLYGQFASCLALTSFTAIIFNLGLDNWLLRVGGKQPQILGELAGSLLIIKFLGAIIWFCILTLINPLLNSDTYPPNLLLWSAIVVALDGFLLTILTTFKSALQNKIPSIIEPASDLLWFGATILLIYTGYQQPVFYMQVRVIALIIGIVIGSALIWRKFGLNPNLVIIQKAITETIPFAASDLLAWTTMRADVVIIGLTLGKQAVGLYSPTVGLVNALFIVPMAVYSVMLPVLSNLYLNKPVQAVQTAKRTVILLFFIGIGLSLGLIVITPWLVALLGKSFTGSLEILFILSMILFFKSISFGMVTILVARGKQVRRAVIQAISAGSNIILNILVVYRYGILGVAVVYVLTEVIMMIGYSCLVWNDRSKPVISPVVSTTVEE